MYTSQLIRIVFPKRGRVELHQTSIEGCKKIMTLKGEYQYLSCCGRFYCAYCSYHKGTRVEAAKNLLRVTESSSSLRLTADSQNACDFDEFMKGLRWLASQNEPCRGCRFGGGWSWWPDCPVRDCTIQKGVNFCFECANFPCKKLTKEPLLEYKKTIIEANHQMKTIRIDDWIKQVKRKYKL